MTVQQLFVGITIVLLSFSCATTEPSRPSQARNCVELVDVGRVIAVEVLDRIEKNDLENVKDAELEKAIKEIQEVSQTDVLLMRSLELGCDQGKLQEIACRAFQGLSQKSRGQLSRDYLRSYFEACG
tara:strand:- start:586 stop:966 length:381 start_codon:yes stop_codon:yes gene_type:complete